MTANPLEAPVKAFLDELTPILRQVAANMPAVEPDRLDSDVALDAFDLCAAFIDSDGLHTDAELWAFIATFGPLLESQLVKATPEDVRKANLIVGKRSWLERPPLVFEILVGADQRDGTAHAWRYYDRAMDVAHMVTALDAHPSHLELSALERFRTLLLRRLADAKVAREGRRPGEAPGGDRQPATEGPSTDAPVEEKPLPPPRSLEELYAELDGLVGLHGVKQEVKLVANLLKVHKLREERGLPVPDSSHHLVFTGNPGTGKTTVARLLAEIYRVLGVVKKGHLVETDRSQLVAGYVGQTAIQVRQVFESAMGGVLLIDEAYALARGGERDFGREAIDTLVKLIEDHRDEIVVIVAGYTGEMATFIDSNPGLRSRFPKTIHFPDYSDEELLAIFESIAAKSTYRCEEEARAKVEAFFASQPRGPGFGNGRLARNLFEAAMARHASRIVEVEKPSDDDLCTFVASDIPAPGEAALTPTAPG